jgi:small-conductance mechanosensitive channel
MDGTMGNMPSTMTTTMPELSNDLFTVLNLLLAAAHLALAIALVFAVRAAGRSLRSTGMLVVAVLVLAGAIDLAATIFGRFSAPVAIIDLLLITVLVLALLKARVVARRLRTLEELLEQEREARKEAAARAEAAQHDRELALRDRLGSIEY